MADKWYIVTKAGTIREAEITESNKVAGFNPQEDAHATPDKARAERLAAARKGGK